MDQIKIFLLYYFKILIFYIKIKINDHDFNFLLMVFTLLLF